MKAAKNCRTNVATSVTDLSPLRVQFHHTPIRAGLCREFCIKTTKYWIIDVPRDYLNLPDVPRKPAPGQENHGGRYAEVWDRIKFLASGITDVISERKDTLCFLAKVVSEAARYFTQWS